ncbi:MAG: DUF2155 domain-containing protein [Stellaceae bacterium]
MKSRLVALGSVGVALFAGGVHPVQAEAIAVLQGLDKTTARIATIDAPVNQQVRYGNLLITARACVKNPPMEAPENSAFLQIDELPPDAGADAKATQIFSGWMFSSSPALSALENPVYDISVLECKDVPAPGSPSPAPASSKAGSAPPAPTPPKSTIVAKPLP